MSTTVKSKRTAPLWICAVNRSFAVSLAVSSHNLSIFRYTRVASSLQYSSLCQEHAMVNSSQNNIRNISRFNDAPASNDAHLELFPDFHIPRLQPASVVLDNLIGQGGSARVYKGTMRGSTVAIKQFIQPILDLDTLICNEVKLLTRLRDSNFMFHTFGYIYDGRILSIVMAYAENGDLLKYLCTGKLAGNWRRKAKICMDIAEAVESLHVKGIIHGDLKPENILLDSSLVPKISDLGLSKTFTSISRGSTLLGHTFRYSSPERLLAKKLTHQELVLSDIYSYGMIVWVVATDGKRVYEDFGDRSVEIAKFQKGVQLEYIGTLPDNTPRIFRDIVCRCLEYNASYRPSLTLVQNAFIAYTNNSPSPLILYGNGTGRVVIVVPAFLFFFFRSPMSQLGLRTAGT
ncbi:kinase-like domain-containing protein [Jimgerdemannia flammicorona]|uniref:Kinase-like domain-containing protein n=1 Tax=Jimgerdemannia flammicorona TaxID=994334 RepID=A0A433CVZ5_9FUNG|nr:kinase-like domain-containing protein [Jimgerdemannia flammicorona]